MSENKATTKSYDRANISKMIAEKEDAVKSLMEKIRISSGALEALRASFNAGRKLFVDKLEEERATRIAEEQQALAAKEAENRSELPADNSAEESESVAESATDGAQTEDEKPGLGSIPRFTVEDFTAAQKIKKNNYTVVQTYEKQQTVKPADNFSNSKKKPVSQPDKNAKKRGEEKKPLNKKERIKKGYEQNHSSVEYDELSGEIMKVRVRKSGDRDKKKQTVAPAQMVITHAVINSENLTIKQLSEKIGKSAPEIIKKLFLELGIMNKTINDNIDFDTAELIAAAFNITLELKVEQTSEEKLISFHNDEAADDPALLAVRPPIVTIMGHVDHGKTSILDYIRKANVALGEAGGITQHIGAYTISVPYDGQNRSITFLDTPGHEAFTAMRARGADITDIVVIVVAADDGIMPQTVEAINHAKAAKVPIIVAINKMDKVGANPDRVLQQLADNGLVSEEWMGDVPTVRVSAKTGMNIDALLENILATAEVSELKANPARSAKGTIIEAKLDKGKGPVATVLVQNGTLKVGDFMVAGTATGRVRAMFDDKGRQVVSAAPSTPVSVLGLQEVPNAGDQMMVVKDEKLSREVAEERKAKEKIEKLQMKKATLEDVFSRIEEGKLKDLNIILKADVQGSVEAVKQSLLKLSNDEVKVHVVHSGVGAINDSDVGLAFTADAIIIGFNVRPDQNARASAEKNGVDIRLYRVIYDAINDVEKAIKGMLAPTYKEVYLGRAEVRQIYKISSVGTIAGCMVKDGKVTRNAKVRLIRNGVVVTETAIASLRRMKDDVKEVVSGYDCGIGLEKYNDIHVDDVIEAYIMEEESR